MSAWGDLFSEHTQHLIPVGVTSDVAALQQRIRDLQEENERLAALTDHYLAKLTEASEMMLRQPVVVSRAAVVHWVALSAGWHHWPCVTTGAKVPEREPHPLHRAIAVCKEGFPRG